MITHLVNDPDSNAFHAIYNNQGVVAIYKPQWPHAEMIEKREFTMPEAEPEPEEEEEMADEIMSQSAARPPSRSTISTLRKPVKNRPHRRAPPLMSSQPDESKMEEDDDDGLHSSSAMSPAPGRHLDEEEHRSQGSRKRSRVDAEPADDESQTGVRIMQLELERVTVANAANQNELSHLRTELAEQKARSDAVEQKHELELEALRQQNAKLKTQVEGLKALI
jgi:hypothetical protein